MLACTCTVQKHVLLLFTKLQQRASCVRQSFYVRLCYVLVLCNSCFLKKDLKFPKIGVLRPQFGIRSWHDKFGETPPKSWPVGNDIRVVKSLLVPGLLRSQVVNVGQPLWMCSTWSRESENIWCHFFWWPLVTLNRGQRSKIIAMAVFLFKIGRPTYISK